MTYRIVRSLLRLLSFFFFPARSYGSENIPAEGSFILASNHLSNLDPPAISIVVKRRLNFLAKDTLFANKFIGAFLRSLGAIPVKRESSDIGALREALKRLRHGQPLVIFPEGVRAGSKTRITRDGPAYAGIGFLVAKSGVPVIPVKMIGTDRVMPPGARAFKRNEVTIVMGKPVVYSAQDDYAGIARQIMAQITSLEKPRQLAARHR